MGGAVKKISLLYVQDMRLQQKLQKIRSLYSSSVQLLKKDKYTDE